MKSSKHKMRKSLQKQLNKIVKDINVELKNNFNGRFFIKQKSLDLENQEVSGRFIWKWCLFDYKQQLYFKKKDYIANIRSDIGKAVFIIYLQNKIKELIINET